MCEAKPFDPRKTAEIRNGFQKAWVLLFWSTFKKKIFFPVSDRLGCPVHFYLKANCANSLKRFALITHRTRINIAPFRHESICCKLEIFRGRKKLSAAKIPTNTQVCLYKGNF